MPSPEARACLSAAERALVGEIARAALAAAVEARAYAVAEEQLLGRLGAPGASFVTLERRGELRGCIGSLEPRRALGHDVARNTHGAAREDLRFPPVGAPELGEVEIHVAVLSPATELAAAGEAELLAALRPGIDGLVVAEGRRRATFLPAVWRQLPEPKRFLDRLREKAGLAPSHWSPTLRFWRYTVEPVEVGRVAATG